MLGGWGLTTGLAESNGSLPPGLWLRSPAADCRGLGSAPEPYTHFEYGTTLLPIV